jgi:hypothetical protein
LIRSLTYLLFCCLLQAKGTLLFAQKNQSVDLLVVGGGTSGVAAGIAASRMGVSTLIAEETVWLGGMLSAAGVSATDGNHLLPSGLWGEFRNKIYAHYGGASKVATGWVSNTHFEPHVANKVWQELARAERNLKVLHRVRFLKTLVRGKKIVGAQFISLDSQKKFNVYAKQVIDATELGDVLASAGVPYDVGMEASAVTGENVNVPATNNIIQDLTYVAVLKDYGKSADCTIAKPVGYDPTEFDGCCLDFYSDTTRIKPGVDCAKMITYAKLPGNKYMLNWPGHGNDIYLNIISLSPAERELELQKAKQQTLRYIYFLQHQLGYKNLGLAVDEFPTSDRLALIPYHREGRRMQGLIRFKVQDISEPYLQPFPLYRTGIAVGDYPIDHHHRKNPEAPQHLGFYPIPSFSVPLGVLLPSQKVEGLIAAEKAISVSNVVNGTTRLQPCVLLIGQAAGTLAALAIKGMHSSATAVSVRDVQSALLSQKAYLLPYADVTPSDKDFFSIQRIGATGFLRGKGQPNAWANRTWFEPDSTLLTHQFIQDLLSLQFQNSSGKTLSFFVEGSLNKINKEERLSIASSIYWVEFLQKNIKSTLPSYNGVPPTSFDQVVRTNWGVWGLADFNPDRLIKKRELAVIIDKIINPFYSIQINHFGNYVSP